MFRRKSRSYLLDVVVAQGAAILELLTSEDETLLIRGDTLLILDLGLDVVDGVARLDVEGNGLTREGLDETMEFEKNHWSANCSLPLLEFPPPCHFPKVFPVSSPFSRSNGVVWHWEVFVTGLRLLLWGRPTSALYERGKNGMLVLRFPRLEYIPLHHGSAIRTGCGLRCCWLTISLNGSVGRGDVNFTISRLARGGRAPHVIRV
ncbi:uncharacterized protein BO72DRAFT_238626 [Aspergillus fijiensis CBS 313.89]|uniref:Uncharacterized protein n=1 Tax=Aspergillus fijiensis CBS 313.89 TaxID=1448319 RepID=A0A8G1RY97_9EURO|nr:uncharacterized protein BO72DRAFT_238626 [Aspergillus fijiensis CBS 313.89]RAK81089.1 hypothetical protein BO72DRAFT_238626 [Aspergillus fijiensis CBS 313.89]